MSDTLLDEYNRLVEKYGQKTADRIMGLMLKNYKRLVYIDTGLENQAGYPEYARKVADLFNLRFEVMHGSNALIEKMLVGDWDTDFVIVKPGETVTYASFKTTQTTTPNLDFYRSMSSR